MSAPPAIVDERRRSYLALLALLLGLTVLRGWRVPNAYATAHWLFSYEHGFIARGLVGTILAPLVERVGPRVAYVVIAALGAALVGGFFVAVVVASRARIRRHGSASQLAFVPLLFVCSPAAVYAVHCIGYFDAALLLLGVVAIGGIARGWHAAVGLVCAVGVLVHELFIAIAFPAVVLALLVDAARDRRGRVLRWASSLVPPLAAVAAVVRFGTPGRAALDALEADILAREVIVYEEVPWVFVPFESSLSESLARMRDSWAGRSFGEIGWDLGQHLPFIAFAFASLTVGILRQPLSLARRTLLIVVAALVIVAPLSLHAVAWDLERIDAFAATAALLAWLAVWSAPAAEGTTLAPATTRWTAMAVVVAALSLTARPKLFDQYVVADFPEMFERVPAEARKLRKPLRYRDIEPGEPLFDNADFERGTLEGWTLEGDAFAAMEGEPWLRQGRPAVPEGRFWASSRGSGRATGRLISPPFAVTGDTIAFKLGAGDRHDATYVAFVVAGKEVARYWAADASERMDLVRFDARPYRGATMTIEVVDEAAAAHLNVDGFCWAK